MFCSRRTTGTFFRLPANVTGALTYPPLPTIILGLNFDIIESDSNIPVATLQSPVASFIGFELNELHFTNFISNPSLGTIVDSMPFSFPINNILLFESFSFNALATAIAGYR